MICNNEYIWHIYDGDTEAKFVFGKKNKAKQEFDWFVTVIYFKWRKVITSNKKRKSLHETNMV